MRPDSILIMTLQLSEKLDVYKVGLGSLRRYMDRFTTDLFDRMSQVVNEAIAVGDETNVSTLESSSVTTVASEKFGKFFSHDSGSKPAESGTFEEIDLLRGNVNRLEVLHAKLQYMMVELESLAKRA
ncbi:MAG: hypothetical protein K2X47_09310 [Bdellovibrionales bacterium]|nr:hypothetical protein [Bdellovibrionales bacterium]